MLKTSWALTSYMGDSDKLYVHLLLHTDFETTILNNFLKIPITFIVVYSWKSCKMLLMKIITIN